MQTNQTPQINRNLINIDFQLFTSSLWESNYNEYQEFLYQLIYGLYNISVTGKMGYRRISQYQNTLGSVLLILFVSFTSILMITYINMWEMKNPPLWGGGFI
jgi:hypothetical protein